MKKDWLYALLLTFLTGVSGVIFSLLMAFTGLKKGSNKPIAITLFLIAFLAPFIIGFFKKKYNSYLKAMVFGAKVSLLNAIVVAIVYFFIFLYYAEIKDIDARFTFVPMFVLFVFLAYFVLTLILSIFTYKNWNKQKEIVSDDVLDNF